MAKQEKTNAMRLLEAAKIPYIMHTYPHKDGESVDGVLVAGKLGQPIERVFKTLVTKGTSGDFAVFVIPVGEELNLKKAAKAVGEKSVEMIAVKDLLKTTGYIRGGCSPIGMKKPFQTVVHESALLQDTIIFSGGKIGFQIEMSPHDLIVFINASTADIVQ